ncbi:hypothetical protein TYRP_023663 [Tyrophagus putrescentiae]|nr:hypothetical protein TYRP_023663 [Tyrophagus putrescentiae]
MGSIAEEMLLLLLYTGRSVSVPDVDLFPLLLTFLLFLLAFLFGGCRRHHHFESVISGRIWLQIWPTGGLMASSRRWEPHIVSVDTASLAFLIRCRRRHGWQLTFPGPEAGPAGQLKASSVRRKHQFSIAQWPCRRLGPFFFLLAGRYLFHPEEARGILCPARASVRYSTVAVSPPGPLFPSFPSQLAISLALKKLEVSSARREHQFEWSDQVSVDTASSAFLILCRRHHGWHLIFPGAVAGSETARGFLCPLAISVPVLCAGVTAAAALPACSYAMLLLLACSTPAPRLLPNRHCSTPDYTVGPFTTRTKMEWGTESAKTHRDHGRVAP